MEYEFIVNVIRECKIIAYNFRANWYFQFPNGLGTTVCFKFETTELHNTLVHNTPIYQITKGS